MRLILIRHGESHHTQGDIIAGTSGCTGLTEHGFAQARRLADRLRITGELKENVSLLSSPVPRARQTAEILATVLPGGPIEIDCDLCELHPGEADGLSWADYRSCYGVFDLPTNPDRPFAPGGESWKDFVGRVRATLDRLAGRFDGQTAVVVSHAGFIVLSFLELFSIPSSHERAWLHPIHTSLTEWRFSNTTWHLERYNDAYHLFDQA